MKSAFTNIISLAIVLRCKHSCFCLGLLTARLPSDGSLQRLPSILSASLLSPSVWLADGAGCVSEERLFHKLFSHYNQLIRPVENVSEPVTVHFEVAITQLANVVSASRSPDSEGSESPTILLLPAHGRHGNYKNTDGQESSWLPASRSHPVVGETFPTDAIIIHINRRFVFWKCC